MDMHRGNIPDWGITNTSWGGNVCQNVWGTIKKHMVCDFERDNKLDSNILFSAS